MGVIDPGDDVDKLAGKKVENAHVCLPVDSGVTAHDLGGDPFHDRASLGLGHAGTQALVVEDRNNFV